MDTKKIIPGISLPRFQGDKRKWLDPVKLEITDNHSDYEISFLSTRGRGKRKFAKTLPKTINIDYNFKCALVAYMCEGTKLRKGIYTKNSGNKGKNIQFSNSDLWLIKLIIDEFQKLGIERDAWKARITLYSQHNEDSEKRWWSKKLQIPFDNFKIKKKLQGDLSKASYAPHGICSIELYSLIYATVIDNLINLLKQNKI